MRSESGTVKLTAHFENSSVSLPVTTKSGYACGYSTASNSNTITYLSRSYYTPTSNVKLYVICNKNVPSAYTILLNQQGGSNGSASVTATYGNAMPSISLPTRNGYIFGGYFTGTNGSGTQYYTSSGASARNWNLTSDTTLYAQWKSNTYTVSYSCGSGTGTPPSSQTATYGQTFTTSTSIGTCSKSGYKFSKWYDPTGDHGWTNWSGTWTYVNGQFGITNNSLVLTAQWTAVAPTTSTITFNANGGSGSMTAQTVNNNQSTTLKANSFTKANATFTGWNTNANGTGTSYSDKANITINSNITLYAQWKSGTTLKVGTFNVGYFACGSSTPPVCQKHPSTSDVANMLLGHNFDIIGVQEARDPGKVTSEGPKRGYINTVKNKMGYNAYVSDAGSNINAILSKLSLNNKKTISLKSGRSIGKVVITVNGVDISFYNTHLGLNENNEINYNELKEAVKNDSNPVIITGDFNWTSINRFNQYLKPEGFVIAAHDDSGQSMNHIPDDYMDSVFIRPYDSNNVNHISVISSNTVVTLGTYSDHNLVIANLLIY